MTASLTAFAVGYLVATTVGGVVSLALAVVAWQRRDQPAAVPFALLNLDVACWCLLAVLVRIGVPGAVFVWQITESFIFAFPFIWFGFALAYTGRSEWLRSKPALVLWAIPVVVGLSTFFPPARALLVTTGDLVTVLGLTVVEFSFTTLGTVLLVSVLSLDLLAFGLLGSFFLRSRSVHRRQISTIVGARLFGFGTAVAFYTGLLPFSDLTLIPAAYSAQSVIIGLALFRYDLFDVSPLVADTILEQMSDGVVVLDDADCIVDHNRAFATIVGADAATLEGRHCESVLPDLPAAIDSGSPVSVDREVGEGPPERVYEPESTPLYDQHDIYRGRVVALRDVTLQQSRERTLEALQSATQAFIDATDAEAVANTAVETTESGLSAPYCGVALADESTDTPVVTAMSEELVAEFRAAGVLETSSESVAIELPVTEGRRVLEAYESGTEILGSPLTFIGGDQRNTVPTTLVFPLGDHGVLAVGKPDADSRFSDEERRSARTLARATETALDSVSREQELKDRTEQLRFFNSALRHDLRNAVTVVDANLDLLSAHVTDSGEEPLRTVSEWIADIESLVDTVGSITTAITDDDEIELSPVDLADVVDARIDKIADSHASLTIESDIPPGTTVLADELFGEVVENLLLNAVEHNDRERPHIDVSAESDGDSAVIRIADDGPGIDEELRGEVFGPGVTTGDSGSIGFGLYFVKVMAETYGGSIHFEANDPRGTVAVLTLPLARRAPSQDS